MRRIKFFGFNVRIPRHWLVRLILGILLVIGGIFSFLPLLGIWMLPLGLVVLSVDSPFIRRLRRRLTLRMGFWLHSSWPSLARRIGFTNLRASRLSSIN